MYVFISKLKCQLLKQYKGKVVYEGSLKIKTNLRKIMPLEYILAEQLLKEENCDKTI